MAYSCTSFFIKASTRKEEYLGWRKEKQNLCARNAAMNHQSGWVNVQAADME